MQLQVQMTGVPTDGHLVAHGRFLEHSERTGITHALSGGTITCGDRVVAHLSGAFAMLDLPEGTTQTRMPWLPEGPARARAADVIRVTGAATACPLRNSLWFTPDGKALIAAQGSELLVWRKTAAGDWQGPVRTVMASEVVTLAVDSKGEQVAISSVGTVGAGTNDMEVRALNNGQIASNALASSRGKQGNPVLALAFSADDKLVVATTQDPGVSTWEFQIDQNRNALGEQQDRAVDHVATRWRDGIHTQFSADRAGQVEACFGPLIGSTCTRLGRSFGTPITGLAVNDEGTRLIVSGPGLFRWDLGRAEMLATAHRLANKGQ